MLGVQSTLVPIKLSADNKATFYDLVCMEQYGVPVETTVTQTETFCGIFTGLGAIKFNPSGTAVCEIDPNSTQVSYDAMLDWQLAKNYLYFKVDYPGSGSVGSGFSIEGNCYVTKTELKFKTNTVVEFDWTLTGDGIVTSL